ncbi:MAG: tetratricopeptide repeat protein [Nitrospirota bacterium]
MNIHKAIESGIESFHAGDFRKSEEICKKILKKDPENVEALHLQGSIFSRTGKYDSALVCLSKALQINPGFAEAYHTLGIVYYERKEFDQAIRYIMQSLRLQPAAPKVWFHLGMILQDRGKTDEAITAYQEALYLKMQDVRLLNNLGLLCQNKGQVDKALVYFGKALEIDPECAETHYNMGNALRESNKLDQAIDEYQKALHGKPDFAEALNNIGLVFYKKTQFQDAEAFYQKALQVNPSLFEAYNNLGNLFKETGHTTEAATYYYKALELNPEYAGIYNNTGTVLKDQGKIQEADHAYRQAIQLAPEPSYYSNLLLLMNYSTLYDRDTVFREHKKFAELFAEPLASAVLPHTNDRSPFRRLRIGYASPDFRRHSVNYFLEPVLTAHNHEQFEIFCYSDVSVPDACTRRLKASADQWREITGVPNEKVAEQIRNDGIDILIDLAGHTGYNRLLLFARKPAPVQVSWLGYPNTTGLPTIDYRIVDRHTDPPGTAEQYYTERLFRMPETFLCYEPDRETPDIAVSPFLISGHVTFGSFNNFAKETPEVLALWAEILRQVADSRLILKARSFIDSRTRDEVLSAFAVHGIDPARIELLSLATSFSGHLGIYSRIDIGLDPFPYNGTTTTCEALWMGVPVITLAGNTHASRVGASILTNVGLSELIATSQDEYVGKAVYLAGDLEKLESLRRGLREMMKQSPLTDAGRLVKNLEDSYRQMWEIWCKGSPLTK